jgi:hypothetical protein
MSVFQQTTVRCPACGADVPFRASMSVNADRRPDLREQILREEFQRQTCPSCSHSFRLAPDLNYLDAGRGQWFAAHPVEDLARWAEVEERDLAAFAAAYGDRAPPPARAIGAGLTPRVTFGWSGLREKIHLADLGLDDVTVECVKLALLRTQDDMPVRDDTDLRLVDTAEDVLLFAWIEQETERVAETIEVPRSAYDEVVADADGWAAVRAQLTAGPFVDVSRLLVVPTAAGG